MISGQGPLDLVHSQGHLLSGVKGTDADVAGSAFSKTASRGYHHPRLFQQKVKELPGIPIAVNPDVGGVFPAAAAKSQRLHVFSDDLGVSQIVVGYGDDLPPSFLSVDRLGGPLYGVGYAVELGAMSAVPEGVDLNGTSRLIKGAAGFGDHREGASGSGKSRGLGEAAEFDSHLLRLRGPRRCCGAIWGSE